MSGTATLIALLLSVFSTWSDRENTMTGVDYIFWGAVVAAEIVIACSVLPLGEARPPGPPFPKGRIRSVADDDKTDAARVAAAAAESAKNAAVAAVAAAKQAADAVEALSGTTKGAGRTGWASLKTNQRVFLKARILVGLAGVFYGAYSYPLGTPKVPDKAVPLAFVIVGSVVAAQAVLDFFWMLASQADMASGNAGPNSDSTSAILGVYVASIATVLGLIAVFNTTPTYAIRFGTLVLVIGLILGLMVIGYTAYGIAGLETGTLLAWMVSLLFATTGLGLACIGLSVFYS